MRKLTAGLAMEHTMRSSKNRCNRFLIATSVLVLTACGDSNDFGSSDGAVEGPPRLMSVELNSAEAQAGVVNVGDTVTVDIVANESILAPLVIVGGSPVDSIIGSGTSWTGTITVKGSSDEGNLPISVAFRDISGDEGVTVTATTDASAFSLQKFELIWSDEFDGTELDLSKWNIQTGDGCPDLCGWGNNELQIYTEDSISVANGILTLQADFDGTTYTSGRINTENKFDFTFGRVVARAKLPEGSGTWPAFWMFHTDETYGVWPRSGEMDIMEATNLGVNGKQTISSAIHYGFEFPNNIFNFRTFEPGVDPQADFHEYVMEWEAGVLRFYFDDIHYHTETADNWFVFLQNNVGEFSNGPDAAPFDHPFHILLNFAVGGTLPGAPDGTAVFPQNYDIDYVRVFRCINDAEDACKTNVNPDIAPTSGVGAVSTGFTMLYSGVAPENLVLATNENQLQVGSFNPAGELKINDFDAQDPNDPSNSVWRWMVSGGVANTFLGSQNFDDDETLATGFILTDTELLGEISFDMFVDELSAGTSLVIKMDSGFPNLGQVTLSDVVVGENRRYTVTIADLLANPLAEGSGLNLSSVLNLFVIEAVNDTPANIVADVYIDNINFSAACREGLVCDLRNATKISNVDVFIDELASIWTDGISAFDQALSFNSCTNDDGAACPSINWQEVEVADRGDVLEVTYAADAQFAGLIIGSVANGIDLSDLAAGNIEFDLNVTANPSGASFVMKADCVACPVNAGEREQDLGIPGAGFQSFSVPVADLINANGGPSAGGLVINAVTTGLVIFPTFGNTAGVSYQIDNVRWTAN